MIWVILLLNFANAKASRGLVLKSIVTYVEEIEIGLRITNVSDPMFASAIYFERKIRASQFCQTIPFENISSSPFLIRAPD